MFDPNEKERIRYHLGYLNVQPAASINFGIPVPIQTMFLVEMAMDNILQVAEDRVRKILTILDGVECKLVAAQDYLVVSKVDEIELRANHPDLLEQEYCRWAARLSDELGAPLYPGATKFRSLFGVGIGSVPVRH